MAKLESPLGASQAAKTVSTEIAQLATFVRLHDVARRRDARTRVTAMSTRRVPPVCTPIRVDTQLPTSLLAGSRDAVTHHRPDQPVLDVGDRERECPDGQDQAGSSAPPLHLASAGPRPV